ncbi:MAG: VOC family protein [Actinobacteria bacterium]|nr:VOC family protein [Actinomycetota bacterium]
MGDLVRWKDLVTDTTDPAGTGRFWAGLLGRVVTRDEDGDVRVDGSSDAERIWVDRVPERRAVKDRVHLDLVGDVPSLRRTVERLGGRHVADRGRWTVVADPEGGEFCLFPATEVTGLVVDARRPVEIARWWAEAFGATPRTGPDGLPRWLPVPGAPFDVMKFVAVAEPKTVKNRRHWDVWCEDVPALVGRGATVLREPDDEIGWTVLADPEGNEFCAFMP